MAAGATGTFKKRSKGRMSKKLHTEELIRTQLSQVEQTPSAETWKAIQHKLAWKQFFRFYPGRMNIYYASVIALVLTATIWGLSSGEEPEPDAMAKQELIEPAMDSPATESKEQVQPEKSKPDQEEIQSRSDRLKEKETQTADAELTNQQSSAANSADRADSDLADPGSPSPIEAAALTDPVNGKHKQDQIEASGALIQCSEQIGCAPLAVTFTPRRELPGMPVWDFGDGTGSKEQSPTHLFEKSGVYHVHLKGGDGAVISSTVIEILASPLADFQVDEGFEGMDNHVVLNLLNYSSDASNYDWCMVDEHGMNCSRWSSDEHQPTVRLNRIAPESRAIRLQATNEYGCRDSAFILLPLDVETSDTRIKFPTAFSPNPSGPGDGTFHPGSRRIDVFHPIYVEVPAEFHLRVFNRRGELIFETREIYSGWDGYLNSSLAESDVYVWMAEGKWDTGESFTYRGDVTVILNQYW